MGHFGGCFYFKTREPCQDTPHPLYFETMRKCEKCGKGSQMGGERKLLRGHYNPVNWSRKYPNLQWGRLDGKRAKL
jgi:hypothetical protein